MKLVLRIFNIFILALSAAAAICLFAVPTFSFNSNIALDVKGFSQFVPQTEFTENIDIARQLGTNTIEVGISFKLGISETSKVMNGDRDIINNEIISKNVNEIVATLHEPVNLITDYTIRSVIKSTLEKEVTTQIQTIIDNSGGAITSTAEDLKYEVGMDDEYFTSLSYLIYDAANEEGATVDSVTDVLFIEIDEALAKADYAVEEFDKSSFTEESKATIKSNLLGILQDMKLVNGDNSLKKINQVSYMYLSDYLKTALTGKVADDAELEQRTGETTPDYADRLLGLFVLNQTPAIVYQIVGYVALGLFIGMFVFAAIWAILFIITLVRTFSRRKPWTIFGPWFWIFGSLQIVLGVGLTVFGKFILPNINLTTVGIPLSKVILAPRTYALIPSLIFISLIAFAIVYAVFKSITKGQIARSEENDNAYNG